MEIYPLAWILIVAFCPWSVKAWQFDASCQQADQAVLRPAINQAFAMAQQASAALNPNGRDVNVNRLIRLLFCAPNEDPATRNMARVKASFDGIWGIRTELFGPVVWDNNEVAIYCNIDRVQKNAKGIWIDGSNGVALQPDKPDDPDKHDLDKCLGNWNPTNAFTWNPTTFYDVTTRKTLYPACQITICPWFLEWAKVKGKYLTWDDVTRKAKTGNLLIATSSNLVRWPFTNFDALNLLDKVMLHELTHTLAGGDTIDVEMSSGGSWYMKDKAYGWKVAQTLANQGQVLTLDDFGRGDADRSGVPKVDLNADTLALFASGVRLLMQTPVLYVETINGDVSTNPQSKRQIPPELQYKSTPAAFEGFLTMISERGASATAHAH